MHQFFFFLPGLEVFQKSTFNTMDSEWSVQFTTLKHGYFCEISHLGNWWGDLLFSD
jgi:hypothetical protein